MKRCITLVIFMAPIAILLGAAADPNASLRWADRLESLTPSRPIDYFELAEEIAFEADNPEDERLASTLYVLSFELDRRRAGAETLGRSVCLALAQLSKSEEERRWLLAMSKSLDRRDAPARWGGDA
ncbi:MAG: hypothetical protein VYC34_01410, partial [Planctomycetota bacterium]|nr:hypothetical protein [Planctomycetota bacterium]